MNLPHPESKYDVLQRRIATNTEIKLEGGSLRIKGRKLMHHQFTKEGKFIPASLVAADCVVAVSAKFKVDGEEEDTSRELEVVLSPQEVEEMTTHARAFMSFIDDVKNQRAQSSPLEYLIQFHPAISAVVLYHPGSSAHDEWTFKIGHRQAVLRDENGAHFWDISNAIRNATKA